MGVLFSCWSCKGYKTKEPKFNRTQCTITKYPSSVWLQTTHLNCFVFSSGGQPLLRCLRRWVLKPNIMTRFNHTKHSQNKDSPIKKTLMFFPPHNNYNDKNQTHLKERSMIVMRSPCFNRSDWLRTCPLICVGFTELKLVKMSLNKRNNKWTLCHVFLCAKKQFKETKEIQTYSVIPQYNIPPCSHSAQFYSAL